jgi:prevent-host-death family protein
MRKIVSMAEIQDRFSDCLRAAEEGDTVVVTRDGKPVVALVAASEADRLERAPPNSDAGLAGLAGGWEGSEELVQRIAGRRTSG